MFLSSSRDLQQPLGAFGASAGSASCLYFYLLSILWAVRNENSIFRNQFIRMSLQNLYSVSFLK